MNRTYSFWFRAVAPGITSVLLAGPALAATVDLRVIETTDIHSNVLDFDFYKNTPSNRIGLVRTATLVNEARAEAKNSVLVDNGDLIQGSPMGDWRAEEGLEEGEVHPVHKVMNAMDYDVGNVGNHEFNYGLDYFHNAIDDAAFPYISANVRQLNGDYLIEPYLIKELSVTDTDGKAQTVKVGFIGFVPPQIMMWDRKNLAGKVIADDITATARKLVPEMKKKGADVVIAIPHSGLSSEPYKAMAENSVYYLSQVPDIDALMFGHSHGVFPSEAFKNIPGVNVAAGTVNGVPAVMPGRWGSHIGIVDLTLDNSKGDWQVVNSKVETRAIAAPDGSALVKADAKLAALVESDRVATTEFVNRPIGKASDVMYSFLSLVQDDPTVQIVNQAQSDYVQRFIQGDPDLDDLPVLSAGAPFKAGGRKDDPTDYTEVESGVMTFSNAADLYLYPNTLSAVTVTGKELREWLERSAGMFNQIDPHSTARQALLNWDTFRTYNFDVIDGVNYEVDITVPARYNEKGEVVSNAHRIKKLTYKGKPVQDNQQFLVATNNYRASGGGSFPGTGQANLAFHAPDESRQILANYIARVSKEEGVVKPTADYNWRFAPIKGGEKLNVVFETAASDKAAKFIARQAQYPMTRVGSDEKGFALYRIDLSGG